MELIRLEDSMRLNIPEIDSQHETLIGLINALHQSMLQQADRAALGGLLAQLLAHTQSHFSYEEQLMSQHGYPAYEVHKSEHARLIQHLLDLIGRFQNGDLLMSFAVVIELKGWATIHIEKSDKLLGAFLKDQPGVDTASN
ncbi:MAG: bacteriohemerythrin [Sedimenticolaceae bacterium]|jgi:hemerythrin-like metal-binding protein